MMTLVYFTVFITGYLVWIGIALVVAGVVILVARDAVLAAWFVCRFYSWGPLAATAKHRHTYPFRLWWWALRETPEYVTRKDTNSLVYWPGRAPKAGDDC